MSNDNGDNTLGSEINAQDNSNNVGSSVCQDGNKNECNAEEKKQDFDSSKFKNHFVQVPKLKKPQVMNQFVKGGGDMGNFQDIYKDIKSERLNQRKQAYQKAKESAPPKQKVSAPKAQKIGKNKNKPKQD